MSVSQIYPSLLFGNKCQFFFFGVLAQRRGKQSRSQYQVVTLRQLFSHWLGSLRHSPGRPENVHF